MIWWNPCRSAWIMFSANIINLNDKYWYKTFNRWNIKLFLRKSLSLVGIEIDRGMLHSFREGSKSTPSHPYAEFSLKTYAQIAFRFFRNAFGVDPSSFMVGWRSTGKVTLLNPSTLLFVDDSNAWHRQKTVLGCPSERWKSSSCLTLLSDSLLPARNSYLNQWGMFLRNTDRLSRIEKTIWFSEFWTFHSLFRSAIPSGSFFSCPYLHLFCVGTESVLCYDNLHRTVNENKNMSKLESLEESSRQWKEPGFQMCPYDLAIERCLDQRQSVEESRGLISFSCDSSIDTYDQKPLASRSRCQLKFSSLDTKVNQQEERCGCVKVNTTSEKLVLEGFDDLQSSASRHSQFRLAMPASRNEQDWSAHYIDSPD